jgi:hypothetical protein
MEELFADVELQYYANRGFTVNSIEDRKRAWYISDLGGAPSLNNLTTTDLELMWLQARTGSSSTSIEDQWYAYLAPIYGANLTVRDLRYALYYAG